MLSNILHPNIFRKGCLLRALYSRLPRKLGTILRWPCTALVAFSQLKLFATNPAVFRPFTP